MKTWLRSIRDTLRSSFWFVPAVMAAGAVGLAALLLWLNWRTPALLPEVPSWLQTEDAESARALLGTIAGTVMTALSVVFSITIVALTMAAAQLGPRLLRNFIRDRGNQFVLGMFVGTFLYCLLVLNGLGWVGDDDGLPRHALLGALVLTVVSVGALIYFIHHVAYSIQAPHMVADVAHELTRGIDRAYGEPLDDDQPEPGTENDPAQTPTGPCEMVRAWRSDYVQAVDLPGLMHLAGRHDLVLCLRRRPGHFVAQDAPLVEVYPASAMSQSVRLGLRKAFVFGHQRTATQDLEFSLGQLVEVAVRALSTGINDPTTAITCLDHLGACLGQVCGRRPPSTRHYDDEGALRVIVVQASFSGLVNAAFNQIRQNATDQPAVLIHMLAVLADIAEHSRTADQRAALLRHAVMIHRTAQSFPEPMDRQDLQDRYEPLLRALGAADGTPFVD